MEPGNSSDNQETKMKAFGTVILPKKLPADFLQKNPLPQSFMGWSYCNVCGEVLPFDMELGIILCECIKRFGNEQECDFLKINWSKNYFLSRGCGSCTGGIRNYSIEPYE